MLKILQTFFWTKATSKPVGIHRGWKKEQNKRTAIRGSYLGINKSFVLTPAFVVPVMDDFQLYTIPSSTQLSAGEADLFRLTLVFWVWPLNKHHHPHLESTKNESNLEVGNAISVAADPPGDSASCLPLGIPALYGLSSLAGSGWIWSKGSTSRKFAGRRKVHLSIIFPSLSLYGQN